MTKEHGFKWNFKNQISTVHSCVKGQQSHSDRPEVAACGYSHFILILMSVGLHYDRRRIQQIQLVKGPNRILLTIEDLTFINPQLSSKASASIRHRQQENSLSVSSLLSDLYVDNVKCKMKVNSACQHFEMHFVFYRK